MKIDLLMNDARSLIFVDCELVREFRRLHVGFVVMAPGNYQPTEILKSQLGFEVLVQIPVNLRSRSVPSTISHPREPIFFDLDPKFARDLFNETTFFSPPVD